MKPLRIALIIVDEDRILLTGFVVARIDQNTLYGVSIHVQPLYQFSISPRKSFQQIFVKVGDLHRISESSVRSHPYIGVLLVTLPGKEDGITLTGQCNHREFLLLLQNLAGPLTPQSRFIKTEIFIEIMVHGEQ